MNKKSKASIIQLSQFGDENGKLVVIEGNKDISFSIERVFYIFGSQKDVIRGQHANRKSEFILVNVSGTSKVRVDYGDDEEVYELNNPYTALYIPKMIWKDMYDFSDDSVLLVLSNERYDSNEYIRDYNQFKQELRKMLKE